jgi:hypothetical protein
VVVEEDVNDFQHSFEECEELPKIR